MNTTKKDFQFPSPALEAIFLRIFQKKKFTDRKLNAIEHSSSKLVIGSFLLITAIFIIIWNEYVAIEATKSLSTVFQELKIMTNILRINPSSDGAPVYIHGSIRVDEPLTEPEYGISVSAVILKRRVQMYQWIEEEIEDLSLESVTYEHGSKYIYRTDWRDKLINSSKFRVEKGHENPTNPVVQSGQYISETVRIGAYTLGNDLKKKFTSFIPITSDERPEKTDIKLHAGLYYHTSDVWNPQVGDLRIQFSFAGPSGALVSIIANDINGQLTSNTTQAIVMKGKVAPDMMARDHHSNRDWSIIIYRITGWLCLYFAIESFRPFISRSFAHRHRTIFNVIVLDGTLSPNAAFSTIGLASLASVMWSSYKTWIGVSIFLGTVSPCAICALYRALNSYCTEYKQL